jgi:hypothetical protein
MFKNSKKPDAAIDFLTECIALAVGATNGNVSDDNNDKLDIMFYEYIDGIASAVSDKTTYPLFDDKTSNLIKAGISAKAIKVTDNIGSKSKQITLAAHLLDKLPSFEHIPIDEIISIRNELNGPLIRFRSAMIKFSEDIDSASWDSDFANDADMVFHRDVAPTVLDIEESIKSNNLIIQLLRSISDKQLTVVASSGMGLVLSSLSHLPDAIANSLGLGAAAAPIVFDAYTKWKEKNQQAERNLLYFWFFRGIRG